ncbi:hypothetical protein RB595_006570 [Gaeumannomyces hyphopodioides]
MYWTPLLLLLAPGVLANLDISLIDLVGVIDAADADSCSVGVSVAAACIAMPSFSQLPVASQAKCACCVGTSNIAPEYRDCATYLRSALPAETALYTNNLLLASACSSSSALCAASATAPSGPTTATPTATSATSTRGSTTTTASRDPAACSSFRSIITSCSKAMPSFFDAPGSSQASCVCYNTIGGTFTTTFDRFASSCASYYRTASPTLYSDIRSLSTFCSRQGSAAGTAESNPWFAPDSTTDALGVTPTSRPSFTGTTTVTSSSASSTSTSSAQAGRPVAASGPVGWIASSWTFLVSLFILV